MAKEVGLTIKPQGMPLSELHQAVVRDHKYELAYFYWDHPSDAYWLGPLFDNSGAEKGGPNFLGPLHDSELDGLLAQVRQRRDFSEVQKVTRQIHQHLYSRMPLIPLWQLDTHIAVHKDLKTVPDPDHLDPLRIFDNVEQWRLER
jgi:ABC-type transport system substrate-binding protein